MLWNRILCKSSSTRHEDSQPHLLLRFAHSLGIGRRTFHRNCWRRRNSTWMERLAVISTSKGYSAQLHLWRRPRIYLHGFPSWHCPRRLRQRKCRLQLLSPDGSCSKWVCTRLHLCKGKQENNQICTRRHRKELKVLHDGSVYWWPSLRNAFQDHVHTYMQNPNQQHGSHIFTLPHRNVLRLFETSLLSSTKYNSCRNENSKRQNYRKWEHEGKFK